MMEQCLLTKAVLSQVGQCHVAPSLIIIEFESFYDWLLKVGECLRLRVSVLSLSGRRERVNNSPTPLRYVDIIIFHFLFNTEYHYNTVLTSDDRELGGHLEAEDIKRARTQYETHSSYPGMWSGRWTQGAASPSIKEEKAPASAHQTPAPVTELPPGGGQGSPGSGPYPATFHDTIVFSHAGPTTTSSDILYDSINIAQAYPSLTTSLGKSTCHRHHFSGDCFSRLHLSPCCPLMLSASHLSWCRAP